jgi:uncharacterized protein YyaL (SSP411 family)
MSETLEGSKSPFLQHGSHQPVRWMPWGKAAFERALREDKPILLDIGAVWCHWCHVMDRESYEDDATAALINELFVPVKVDRDERPDVDARYQRAVQAMVGQGGWPLTAFLTPEGDTYYGGTYFPPDDRYGRPSFQRVLREVSRIWKSDRPRALEAVRGIQERLASFAQAEVQPGDIDPTLIAATIEEFAQAFDFRYGGFGRAPKFPNAGGLQLLLEHDIDTGIDWSRRMVLETLQAMARGGVYDQLGGGFHRYSVDARWIIPHFEKMSYDNGPLLEVCARAASVYRDGELEQAARGVVDYYFDVSPALLQQGGFPASQDADFSPEDDGDYWTWSVDEVKAALGDEGLSDAAVAFYGLRDPAGAMHLDPDRHVLFRDLGLEHLAQRLDLTTDQAGLLVERIRSRLKTVRDQRPRPYIDETVYSGWSGLLASGFIAATRHLAAEAAAPAALRALDRIWQESFDSERGIAHRVGDRDTAEQLDDQAHVAQAMLDAFEYTQNDVYVQRAAALVNLVELRFGHDSGAYRDRPGDAEAVTRGLAEPSLSIADSPVPSGNGTMAMVLIRLAVLLGDDAYRQRALRLLRAFGGAAPRLGTSAATYVRAAAWAILPITTVVVVGRTTPDDDALLRAALRVYRPRTIVRWLRTGASVATLPPELQAMISADAPRVYICEGQSCRPPISTVAELEAALLRSE